MILKTRSVAVATAALALVALALVAWQLAKRPAEMPGSSSDSGVVTPSTPAVAAARPAAEPTLAASAAPVKPAAISPKDTPSTVPAPAIKHRVAPRTAAQPPILPNEVDSAVAKALGPKTLARYVYLDPLARRFVATVDNLGNKPAATSLWLLRPAPGALKPGDSGRVPAANSRRYAGFVRWFEATDNTRLISLYARMYPLLQQTYVELGHPGGYFNDRVIEVIDQLMATPVQKRPLRVKPASPETLTTAAHSGTPVRPRYELVDPALEALSTGQKMMLRVGPTQAARLKVKLKALRAGLVRLGR